MLIRFGWDSQTSSLRILEAEGHIGQGSVKVKGLVVFQPTQIQWAVSGKVSDLNIERNTLGKPLPLKGIISADAVLQGSWSSGNSFKINNVYGTFIGEQLAIKEVVIDQAQGIFTWDHDTLTIDSIQAKTKQGRVFGYISINNRMIISANINAENIRICDVLPDAKKIPLDGVFKGNFTFDGPIKQFSGKIQGAFTGITWDSKPIGDITGNLTYQNNQISISDLQIKTDLGIFNAKGEVNCSSEPQMNINIIGSNTNLQGLAAWLPVDPSIQIKGLGQIDFNLSGNPFNPNFKGQMKLTEPEFGVIKVREGLLELSGDLNEIVISKCQLRSDNSLLELMGRVSRDCIDLKIAANSFDISSLHLEAGGNILKGLVNFNGHISGYPSNPVLTAEVFGGSIGFGKVTYQTLSANFVCDSQGLVIQRAEMKQEKSMLSLNGKIQFTKPLKCNLEIKVDSFQIHKFYQFVQLPVQLKIDGLLSGTINIDGPLDNPVIKIRGDISQGIWNELPIIGDFDLSYSKNNIVIDRIEIYQEKGVLVAHGIWEGGRALNAQIQLINFPLRDVNQFLPPPLKLEGVVNAMMTLEWGTDKISGEYSLDIPNLDMNGNIFGNLQTAGDFSSQGFSVKNCLVNGKNGILNGSGYLPWPKLLLQQFKFPVANNAISRQLDLNIIGKNIPISVVNNYMAGLSASKGLANANIHVHGELEHPKISGELECDNLAVNIATLPLPVENFQCNITINDNNILIKKARGFYGTGKFNITGSIDIEDFKQVQLNLGLLGTHLYYKNPFFEGFGDLNLKLFGTWEDSLLAGDISLYNSKIGIIGLDFAKNDLIAWQPKFDLAIRLGNDNRCRVIGFANLAIKGAVQVRGTLTNPKLNGEVDSNNGVLTFYNNTFRIKTAKANFKYSQGYFPYLELESSLKRAQAEVFLNIKGLTPDNIDINLTSQPFMPQANIFGLLNWSELGGEQNITPQDFLTGNISMMTDTIFGDFFFQLRQTLNVNYLYIEPDRTRNDYQISFGSHLTQKLSFSYSRSIIPENNNNSSIGLNYYFDPYTVLEYNYSNSNGVIWRLIYQVRF